PAPGAVTTTSAGFGTTANRVASEVETVDSTERSPAGSPVPMPRWLGWTVEPPRARSTPTASLGRGRLVLRQVTHRQRQRIAPEGITELARHHHLEHRRAALALRLRCIAKRGSHVRGLLDTNTFRAHRLGNRRPGRLFVQVHADEAIRIEIDVILFLG